ncbi:hypothetical protein ARMGADRAFT_683344 [Armillaria gallica]|uniref:Uncharacterized protein n=1 Tax=Armillaria gallica TaxID=47427 RepID=A0A2H3CIU3_ARMGA|nr:hypothetical protein ARMGADRAFT_683246 [Armillaria gallica]PBK83019.1 hypothetical protein ARMGADRAFT_683344 [Armillaria gallica]
MNINPDQLRSKLLSLLGFGLKNKSSMKPLLFLSEALLVQRDAFSQAADEDRRMQDMTRFGSGGEPGASEMDGDALLSSEGCRV